MPDHQRGFAVILLTPLDQPTIKQAHRFLLTVTGATTGTQPSSMPARPKQLIHYQGMSDWWTLNQILIF